MMDSYYLYRDILDIKERLDKLEGKNNSGIHWIEFQNEEIRLYDKHQSLIDRLFPNKSTSFEELENNIIRYGFIDRLEVTVRQESIYAEHVIRVLNILMKQGFKIIYNNVADNFIHLERN